MIRNETIAEQRARIVREFNDDWKKMHIALRVGARCLMAANEIRLAVKKGAKAVKGEITAKGNK